jgi:hypothetical protein
LESTSIHYSALVWQVAMGVGLAASAGLRAFLPMLVVGVAGRMAWIPLSDEFEWLASTPALVVLGVAVVTEMLADKFPVVDHLLDTIQGFVKPIAGTLLAASVLTELGAVESAVLGLISGGAVAGTVHLTKANLRLVSTATTAGLGNPLISAAEDAGALVGSVASIVVPVVVALLALLLIAAGWVLIRRLWRREDVP